MNRKPTPPCRFSRKFKGFVKISPVKILLSLLGLHQEGEGEHLQDQLECLPIQLTYLLTYSSVAGVKFEDVSKQGRGEIHQRLTAI